MRITFCLPNAGHVPIGGFKIVYEYANRLTLRGHQVTLVHPALARSDYSIPRRIIRYGRYIQRLLDNSCNPRRWFPLHKDVISLWRPSLSQTFIPDADVIVATGWETADWVHSYPPSKGRKFHFIQHHEIWAGPPDLVETSWQLPLNKIVISRWLQDLARERGQNSHYIPNGLDSSAFGVDKPIINRDPFKILMLFHQADWKGCNYAIRALDHLRTKYPQLNLSMFGVPEKKDAPSWVNYYSNPPPDILRKLYNEASVFVAPSFMEGWGLTATEAMMSGCAVAASDIGGHREFADQNETALLFKAGDELELATAVERLIFDNGLRVRLASTAAKKVLRFEWDGSTKAFEKVILNH